MVDAFAGREVHMPRLAPPDLVLKVTEAAVVVCDRALRVAGSTGVLGAATTCAALLERWVGTIAAGEHGLHPTGLPGAERTGGDGAAPPGLWDPQASIQDQWTTLRAVAGLAALTKVLVAVYEDSAGRSFDGGSAVRDAADAAMDYVDQVGLRLEGPAWEDVGGMPQAALAHETVGRLAEVWRAFCAAPAPAPRRLSAFVEAVTG